MRDSGFVINTKTDLAEVEIHCLIEACHGCAAKRLCAKQESFTGRLLVKNPIQASAGDQVEIDIPESRYNKALIVIFSILLFASLAGMGLGYLLSFFLYLPMQETSIVGLVTALFFSGLGLFRYFRNRNKDVLYPVIVNILREGNKKE